MHTPEAILLDKAPFFLSRVGLENFGKGSTDGRFFFEAVMFKFFEGCIVVLDRLVGRFDFEGSHDMGMRRYGYWSVTIGRFGIVTKIRGKRV